MYKVPDPTIPDGCAGRAGRPLEDVADRQPRHIPVCAGVGIYPSASDYCPVHPVSSY